MKNKSSLRPSTVIITVSIIMFFIFILFGADFRRSAKSVQSNYTGGLNRVVTVYDYNGNPIQSWEGKFDVSESENEVYFDDQNGKRVIIHGGIVINQEK